MREFDESVGGPCEEDVLTQRWLEDAAPYVRIEYERFREEREPQDRELEDWEMGEGSGPVSAPAAPFELG